MKNIFYFFCLMLSLLLLSGCSQRMADLTVVSTKNVDIGTNYVKVKSNVEGSNMAPIIIFFPLGSPNIESAIDDILKKYDGDIVTNAVIEYQWFYIPYIYGQYKYVIKGDVYKKAEKLRSLSNGEVQNLVNNDIKTAEDFYYVSTTGEKIKVTKVSKEKVAVEPDTNKIYCKD